MNKKNIKDIGEFALIGELKKLASIGPRTVVGIGDDAAVLKSPRKDMFMLLTTDMLVEGTHFDLSRATPYQIGWKAIACSLSDIAAMGGLPTAAVVSIGAPGELGVEFCREMYRGMRAIASRFTCDIVGGDTVGSRRGLVISVTVLGEVEKKRLALRSGARPGDAVWVTGRLGGSIKGKHLGFMPRIREARFLVERFPVRAMMDLSDGLGSDLFRMAEASRVGFRIEGDRIPVAHEAAGRAALRRALYDGEDFELLVVLPSSCREKEVRKRFFARFDCGITMIGTVTGRAHGITIARENSETPLEEGGYSHFGR